MNDQHYILNATGTPVVERDLMKWAKWFETAERTIARTELPSGVVVSTVFLGLDHSYGAARPILFETMIFGGPLDETQDRYETRAAAENGHVYYVEQARQAEARDA